MVKCKPTLYKDHLNAYIDICEHIQLLLMDIDIILP